MVDEKRNDNRGGAVEQDLHALIQQAARGWEYPPTPDFAAQERLRLENRHSARRTRPGKALPMKALAGFGLVLLAVLLLVGVLATPARARLVEFLRLGAVRVFLGQGPGALTMEPPVALLDLAGETTLNEAAAKVPFPLRVPTYPAGLGEPDRVYLQQVNRTPVVIFAWLDPDAPQDVRLALYQIGEGDVFQKQLLENVQETTVNGQWALWVEGPYLLTNTSGRVEERRVVTGRTLIWNENGLTYRLETNLPLEEARKIAESLKAWR